MLDFICSKLFDNDNLENDLSVFKAEMKAFYQKVKGII